MTRGALILMLVSAVTALAGPYTPLEGGATWTYEPEPPAEFVRTHSMGGPTLWHGMLGYPQLELWNVFPHVTTHWGYDDADRLVLQGVDFGSVEAGGTWFFTPSPVFADGDLQPGESVSTQAGVYEVTDFGDQWWGFRTVTVTCERRGITDTPYGAVPSIELEVVWDEPAEVSWLYGRDQLRTYGYGLGLIRIANTSDPGDFLDLTSVVGLTTTAAPTAPSLLSLAAAPTPFNPATAFSFDMPEDGRAELAVYDLAGRRLDVLAAGHLGAGRHEFDWRPRGLSSGVYVARLVTGTGIATARVTLIE